MATVTVEQTTLVFGADARPAPSVSSRALEGDFAAGLRTLPVSVERPDYARGLRTLPMDLASAPDFARGLRQGPFDPQLRGDFATGQRSPAAPGR